MERERILESVRCYLCKGTGMYGVLSISTGIKTLKNCKKCKGLGRIRREVDSEEWKKGKRVSYGLGEWWRRKN